MSRRERALWRLLDLARLFVPPQPVLYSTTVSRALRQPLRSSFLSRVGRISKRSYIKGTSDICLYSRNQARIFRGSARTQQRNRLSSRLTPAPRFANCLPRMPVAARWTGQTVHRLPRSPNQVRHLFARDPRDGQLYRACDGRRVLPDCRRTVVKKG